MYSNYVLIYLNVFYIKKKMLNMNVSQEIAVVIVNQQVLSVNLSSQIFLITFRLFCSSFCLIVIF